MLSEGLVILLSILVAFGLDSWWDERREERDLALELINVKEEFQANLEEMDAWLAAHRRAASSSEALESLLRGRSGDVIEVPDTLVIGPLLYPTVDPSLGGLRTLLQSGRLALVRDTELRLALASWEDALEDLREEELTGKDVTVDRVWPVLLFSQDPVVTTQIVDLHDEFWRDVQRDTALVATPVSVRVSDELIGILIVKKSVARQTVDEFEPLMDAAHAVIKAIDAELSGR